MKVTVWGCRGSIPTPGPSTVRYGGNTSCYGVELDNGRLLILDGGTGIHRLGLQLAKRGPGLDITVLFNHTHWDHIAGFAFFAPLFVAGNRIRAYGPFNLANHENSFENTMRVQWDKQFFPTRFTGIPAELEYHEMREGPHEIEGFNIVAHFMNHSIQALGYRIEADGASMFYTGDHEPYRNIWTDEAAQKTEDDDDDDDDDWDFWDDEDDDAFGAQADEIIEMRNNQVVELCRGVDLLICDAQYTADEYQTKISWGYTAIPDAVDMGVTAEVKRIGLSHHEPLHTDDKLDELEAWAANYAREKGFKGEVFMTSEGQEITL